MNDMESRLSVAAVCFLVGALLVVQLISLGRGSELTRLSAQELSTLIETLAASNREDRSALLALQEQVREYRAAEAQGQSLVEVTGADLDRVSAFAGLAAVQGQGIEVFVDGELDAVALNDLVHELRNAGAEAIAVDDVRLTARSIAVRGAAALEIDGVAIGRRFTMRAIGDPRGLLATLERPGGIVAQLEQFISATIVVTELQEITIPATRVDLRPETGRPVGLTGRSGSP